jgi:error-prone DNA polymerase
MGFYSPHSLVRDARRHGVPVRSPDVNASEAGASLEVDCVDVAGPRAHPGAPPSTWGVGGPAVRLGISSVRGIGDDLAEAIAAGRPYADVEDLARRTGASLPVLEALATAGALDCFGPSRRAALWSVGAVAQSRPDRLPGIVTGATAPALPGMTAAEAAAADLWSTGISADGHPTAFVRQELRRLGVATAADLPTLPGPGRVGGPAAGSTPVSPAHPADLGGVDREPRDGPKVLVAGVVTHRQRPATAGGTIFVNLEDETGLVNVVVSKGCWARHRKVASSAPALLVRGRLERAEGVVNVVAERLWPLDLVAPSRSRDFR